MTVAVVVGSRNPEGRTAQAVRAFCNGVTAEGAAATSAFLPEMAIERCRQCEADGWGICRTEGRCIIEDDFAGLVETMRGADAAVFATPVYFSDLSESLRAFLDRLRRTTRHEAGKVGISDKPAAGICVAGGGGGGAPACAVNLERILGTAGFAVLDMIPVRRQNFELKLGVLEMSGRWFARSVAGE